MPKSSIDPKWKARRLRYGRWRRIVRWEYWPTLPLYLPLMPVFLWNALRYRSLSVVTAVNPGMPSGGFIDDSKSTILEQLRPSGRVADFILIDNKLSLEQQMETFEAFQRIQEQAYPIVLKPDYGERGRGVQIIKTSSEAKAYLAQASVPTIVQAYIPGVEYGVFYERSPSSDKGSITGITLKANTTVTGDGSSSLEALILRDARAVCLAPLFLKMHADVLDMILPAGECFSLNKIGTHSQGSLFLDATDLWTETLEKAVDEASQHFEGFHLGRYDIRVPDERSFRQGRNWKIVELNGVTSEPTHMYDPGHSIIYAWRALAGQWSRAYRYGSLNRALGHTSFSISDLMLRLRLRKKGEN